MILLGLEKDIGPPSSLAETKDRNRPEKRATAVRDALTF